MPSKATPRRQWGSRYDAIKHVIESPKSNVTNLTDDASVSSLSSFTDVLQDLTVSTLTQDGTQSTTDDNYLSGWSQRDGDHRPVTGRETEFAAEYGAYVQRPRQLPRWNHNASVFVASLPSHVSQGEVDTIIRDTLGIHGKILHIKLIHDIKSGNVANCAFVQFEVRFSCSRWNLANIDRFFLPVSDP